MLENGFFIKISETGRRGGLEPTTYGFGDRALPIELLLRVMDYNHKII